MKKVITVAVAVVLMLILMPAVALAGIGSDIPDTGKHWNLNIIGVQMDKNTNFDVKNANWSGNTIFVPLDKDMLVPKDVKINYVLNTADPSKFQILDRDATDDGEATIAVPYEVFDQATNPAPLLSYNVYAVGLGKPGGSAKGDAILIYTVASKVRGKNTAIGGTEVAPGDPIFMGTVDVSRPKGNGGIQKPKVENITDVFRVSGWIDEDGDGVMDPGEVWFDDVWCFNIPGLQSYYWDFDPLIGTGYGWNLKHMQVRFYETLSGTSGTY